jgi:benzoylformate decarboxylase
MRETARLFLDRKIGRRTFISRLAQSGVASAAATKLASSLSAEPAPGGASAPVRVVHNLTGGELMAELLVEWKVPYVFGLGGSEEVGFLDALVDRLSLQYVQGLHEGAVMSMADGYARASGNTPIMNLHSVAGAAYALGPMVNAFKDRVPVVITVGGQSTKILGTNAFLEAVNLHELPREYARWTWDVLSAETIPEVLRRAFVLARVPPGGPTFVTFSKDLWEERVAKAELIPRSRSELEMEVSPHPEHVSELVDLLLAADFPVIAVGKELTRFNASNEVMRIAELLGVPVFQDVYPSHTPVVFPTTHPNYAGMFDEDPAFAGHSDLYWCLGGSMFSLGELPHQPVLPRSTKVIHSGFDAVEIGRTYPVDLAIMANPIATAAAVLEELRRRQIPASVVEERQRKVETHHAERRRRLDEKAGKLWEQKPISTERLAGELNRRLDPEAIVVSELITSEAYLPYYLDVDHRREVRRRNLTSCGGVLGWGVAAAIGAKIAQPDRQVVALVGDGSFQFAPQSLWSAVRYEVPVGIVIWNNNQYQANRRFLHAYGGRAAATGKYIGCNLDSPEVDNLAIARGYSLEAERVEDPEKLGAALDRCLKALAGGRPYLVDVKIERRFGGAESTWFDFFSVARKQPRLS